MKEQLKYSGTEINNVLEYITPNNTINYKYYYNS